MRSLEWLPAMQLRSNTPRSDAKHFTGRPWSDVPDGHASSDSSTPCQQKPSTRSATIDAHAPLSSIEGMTAISGCFYSKNKSFSLYYKFLWGKLPAPNMTLTGINFSFLFLSAFSCCVSYLQVARECDRVPSRVIKHSILRCKHLLVLDVGNVVKVVTPVKHVLAVCVHVPVEDVCGCVRVHVTVGDETHVGVASADGCKECNVVLHIPRLSTVLQQRPCWRLTSHC